MKSKVEFDHLTIGEWECPLCKAEKMIAKDKTATEEQRKDLLSLATALARIDGGCKIHRERCKHGPLQDYKKEGS